MFGFSEVSGNKKTGPIPVSMTARSSCPSACPFKGNGCYAENWPLGLHWSRVEKTKTEGGRGLSEEDFLNKVRAIPRGQLWRHNQAGDLPHKDGKIDSAFLRKLVAANKGRKGFTYTHHELNAHNVKLIKWANENGFTVNVSCENPEKVDRALELGLPAVLVVPEGSERSALTPRGNQIRHCPATYMDTMTCARCGLCQRQKTAQRENRVTVAFPVHGSKKKTAYMALEVK